MMHTQLIVIQATPFCNIRCRYCYLPDRTTHGTIAEATLARIFEAFLTSPFAGSSVTVVWHAGEPLAAGKTFYERAFALAGAHANQPTRVVHNIQTNATLIDQAWCDLFARHGVSVGVSLDGPAWLHDGNRLDHRGRGTFDRVMRGIRLLQTNRLPFSVIAVVTDPTLDHPDEVLRFFAESVRPTSLGFSPEDPSQVAGASTLAPGHRERYRRFLARVLTVNARMAQPLTIRDTDQVYRNIAAGPGPVRSQPATPGAILAFDHHGNISTFSPLLLTMADSTGGRFTFGNVHDGPLAAFVDHPKFRRVHTDIARGVARCADTCQYFGLCGGGFPCEKYVAHGRFDAAETTACQIRVQAVVDAVLDHLEEPALRRQTPVEG